MAFLNQIDKKVTSIGQDAAKKTKEMSDTLRLSGLIREEEKKQQSFYKCLGEYLYLHKQQYEDISIQGVITSIDLCRKKIEQYKSQINQIKGIRICPNCQGEVLANAVYCTKCGAKMKEDTAVDQKKICTNCGYENTIGHTFCVKCGTKLIEDMQYNANTKQLCPNCGETVENESCFCVKCGTKLK